MTASDRLLQTARACSPVILAALAVGALALAACGGEEPEPEPAEPLTGEEAELAEHFREKTALLWEIYNEYDIDGLEPLYEPGYWEEQESTLKRNIKPFESRGVTFDPEETSAPREIEPGKWQLKQKAHISSGGSVNMKFIYEQFGDEWLLTHAEAD